MLAISNSDPPGDRPLGECVADRLARIDLLNLYDNEWFNKDNDRQPRRERMKRTTMMEVVKRPEKDQTTSKFKLTRQGAGANL